MRISERSKALNINMGGVPTWIFILCATTLLTKYAAASEPRVVCYYTNWSVYRPGTARFNPQNINPYLCTHLIYAFGGFTKDNTLKPFDKYQDIEKGGYAKFTGLKTYNQRLKTMLAIGGWNEGSTRFSPMVASKERRKEFVRNAIKFLRQNRFDGLDLDWEYPAFRDGGKPKDRDNYSKLVRELRQEFDRESEKTGKPRLLLTMAVPAGIEYIQKGFDVKALNQYLDWMNLLTYDYHSAFEPAVNHHAPLYPLEEPNEYSVDNELNIDYTIQYYLEHGADPDKLVLGIPTYGRSYTLFNPDATDIGSPADGPGEQGDATREKGYLAYYEICESLKEKPQNKKKKRQSDDDDDESSDEEEEEDEEDVPWTVMQPNAKAMGPFAFRGNQWVGYDDIDIVKKKSEYVAEKGLGGIMFWSIDNDDFRGNCHGKPYPLIEAAKEAYISKLGITDNAITNERPSSSSGSSRRRNRPGVTSTTSGPTTSSRSSSNRRKSSTSSPVSSTTPVWSNNTPEPPTTPDPGSDFKCKDEGFFPHPRDCKKYFWCLDSGPSNLGIVAHQFTCPSGLFFNKAADSCDFSRNVLCKIASVTTTTSKPSTSSTNQPRTSTTTIKPASAVTTTRRPNKLTSKNSVYFRTTSTTTFTPVLDDDEVYEEEIIDDAEAADVESEDPKVIKELIDLIKKAGGVEQLEKHLKLSEASASPVAGTTTALPISKKLYQKVLDQARQGGTNSFLNRYNSLSRDGNGSQNSRGGPQNAGLEIVLEGSGTRKERPQYTTINRSRGKTTTTEEASESIEEPEAQEDEPKESHFNSRVTESNGARPLPQYVNIRRARPSTQAPDDNDDDSASRNALFERNEASFLSTVSDYSPSPSPSSSHRETPGYVTIKRSRPTTTEATTTKYQPIIREKPVFEEVEEEETTPPPAAPQYFTLQRTRPPTTTSSEEPLTSPEPTTVLAVQISSLLNSPVTREPEVPTAGSKVLEPELLIPVTSEASTITEVSTTITTAIPSSSSTPRRTILKRMRSTTTTTTASPTSAAPQVSSERSYTFVRRRRPNDISSDKNEPIVSLRKIRSTTPDSREANGNVQSDGEAGIVSRNTGNHDDTVAAAAAPVARGRFRPNLNREELVSITTVDGDVSGTVPLEQNAQHSDRKVRPRNRISTPTAVAPDAEASAATVEVRRPDFISRSRSRFTISRTTEEIVAAEVTSTEATIFERKPAFSRFTPRPFSRFSPTSLTSEQPLASENSPNITESKFAVATSRLPIRRLRPSTPRTVVPQARIVSHNFRRGSSTTRAPADLEDETLNENDDIHLSESTIEEKEHDDSVGAEAEEKPRRRVIVKKIIPSIALEVDDTDDITSTSENDVDTIAVTPGDDGGRQRKVRVIRRRPTSTTLSVSLETSTVSSLPETSSVAHTNRIRKIIRKKIISTESIVEPTQNKKDNKSEDEELSVVLNYGDKAKPVVFSAKTQSLQSTTSQAVPSSTTTTTQVHIVRETTESVSTESPGLQETTYNAPLTEPTALISSSERSHEENKNQSKDDSIVTETTEVSESTEPSSPSSTSSTTLPKPRFERPLYKPSKRPFTPSTEASIAPSSRTYRRKYNAGTYTSPSTVGEGTERPRALITRRPLFNAKPFSRRPFTTSSTTKKIEEDYSEEEFEEEEPEGVVEEPEIIVEEPESKLVVVPSNLHFTRGGQHTDDNDDLEITDDDISEDEIEKQNFRPTSKKPLFRPKAVNSNTFRISTSTTEIPKRLISGQNRSSIFNKSFAKPGTSEIKKRVQNLPVHVNIVPKNSISNSSDMEEEPKKESINSLENTTFNTAETEESTTDDDYLMATQVQDFTNSESTNTYMDVTSTITNRDSTVTEPIDTDTNTGVVEGDYLESTEQFQDNQSTDNPTTASQHIFSENQTEPNLPTTESYTVDDNKLETVEQEATTIAPVLKTHFDKLFSVSRVVEVSSKLDKHRLNKNNESRLVESGHFMQEKKPTIDQIGEVSRFTLIKIVEGDIPIYLTKLGHVYPVANPPDNTIRIDEGRNARALMNFTDSGRENLVASESVNEAYRHINKLDNSTHVDILNGNPLVELLKQDNFEVHKNEEAKTEKSYAPYPVQWQFVPAAYENENAKARQNKAAKTFDIITPRSYKTDPSTIALEGLFKTENPLLLAPRKVQNDERQGPSNQPFVVYASPRANDNLPTNFVKLQVLKPENGRSIKTYVRGQEFSGLSTVDETTVKYPVSITILTPESEKDNKSEPNTTTAKSTPKTTHSETSKTEIPTIASTTPASSTAISTKTTTIKVETVTEAEITTAIISSDALSEIAKKRPKLTFPRRPIVRNTNITRKAVSPKSQDTTPKILKKGNSTVINTNNKANRTAGFNPSKSRFSANRSQNVPVDLRSAKKTKPASVERQNSTDAKVQSANTDSRKLYFKPIRPNLVRPAFVPRKPSTQAPTKALPLRKNFLRRTKPTEPPKEVTKALIEAASDEVTTVSVQETSTARETTTRKYRLRGSSRFDKKPAKSSLPEITYSPSKVSRSPPAAPDLSRQPDEPRSGPKKRPSSLENETAAQTSGAVRRPTRTYVRRRYAGVNATTTTAIPTTSAKTFTSGSSESTRRPFRVASRRRTTFASSTVAPTTVTTVEVTQATTTSADSDKPSHDLAVQESMEKENSRDQPTESKPRVPHFKKTVKIQRRPLTSLTKEPQTTSAPVTEEPKKRESKKYSASFKQNQLDEVIRQKSAELVNSEETTEPLEDLSVDTAIAIAAHQLLGAPLPSTPNYDDYTQTSSKKFTSSSTNKYIGPSTESYTGYPNSKDYSRGGTGFSNAPIFTSIADVGFSRTAGFSSSSGIPSSSPVYSRGSSSYAAPTSNRYLQTTNKYVSIPIDDFGYSTDSYNGGISHEPVYFTRDYLMESPITRRYETDYQYLSPITTEQPKTRAPKRPTAFRRISTTIAPASQNILILPPVTPQPRRTPDKRVKIYDKIPKTEKKATYRPILNYDYYDDGDEKFLDRYAESSKVLVNGKGNIECLDQGNFPHPAACSKFISCARIDGGGLVGWEYVCPRGLSYDPVGGICNWSAGLGCNE